MTDRPHRPARVPSGAFDAFIGADDPAEVSRIAHDTAAALLHRVRGTDDPAVIARLVRFTDEHGIDDLVELWSAAASNSLPGSLWRLYLIRDAAIRNPEATAFCFRRGLEVDRTISRVVAGAPTPTGPDEIVALCDEILRGAFVGDVGIALARASAYARIMSQGAAELTEPLTGTVLVDGHDEADTSRTWLRRSSRYLELADDLHAASMRWHDGVLD